MKNKVKHDKGKKIEEEGKEEEQATSKVYEKKNKQEENQTKSLRG